MIEINWAGAGVIITAFVSLMCLAAWVGTISEKVKRNSKDIALDRDKNSQEHQRIFDKLDIMRDMIKNGGR